MSILHEALQKRKQKGMVKVPLSSKGDSSKTQRRYWIYIMTGAASITVVLAWFFLYSLWKEMNTPRLAADLSVPPSQIAPQQQEEEYPKKIEGPTSRKDSDVPESAERSSSDNLKRQEGRLSDPTTDVIVPATHPLKIQPSISTGLTSGKTKKTEINAAIQTLPGKPTKEVVSEVSAGPSKGPGTESRPVLASPGAPLTAGSEPVPTPQKTPSTASDAETVEKAVEQNEKKIQSTEAFLEAARRYLKEKKPDMARAIYEQIIKKDPENLEADLGLALALGMNGEWALCKKRLVELGREHPENPRVWLNLGLASLRLHQTEEALSALAKADGTGAEAFWVLFYRGSALKVKGDLEGALSAYQLAHEMQPHHFELKWNRALALDEAGRYQEAASQYQALLKGDQLSKKDRMALRQRLELLEGILPFVPGEQKGATKEPGKQ